MNLDYVKQWLEAASDDGVKVRLRMNRGKYGTKTLLGFIAYRELFVQGRSVQTDFILLRYRDGYRCSRKTAIIVTPGAVRGAARVDKKRTFFSPPRARKSADATPIEAPSRTPDAPLP